MAKDKKKLKKLYIVGGSALGLAIIILTVTVFCTVDIGINRAYFADKAFNKAFNARLTGNCDGFIKYVLTDRENWANKCNTEKTLHTDPFYDFEIRKTTVEGDKAFIQVELTRGAIKDKYPATYQMKLQDGFWMIDQQAF